MSMPAGSAVDRAARSDRGSIGAAKVSSAYSPVEATPTGRASGKDTFGCGVKPSEYAMGRSARRNARSQTEVRSRAEMKRVRPSLVQQMRYRSSTRTSSGSTAMCVAFGGGRQRLAAAESRREDGKTEATGVPGVVLETQAGADAAVVAGGPAAVVELLGGPGILPVLPQPALLQAGVEVVPGQRLVRAALAPAVPGEVDAGLGHGLA